MADPDFEILVDRLREFPFHWDGKECILDLKAANFNWKQMEWIGFYFEYLCQSRLQPPFQIPGPSYGNVKFDAFWQFPWDFKAHVALNKKGQKQNNVIINDKNAINQALDQYGSLGLVIAIGEADYNDEDRSFWLWHQALKGGMSDYERERIKRKAPSRARKVAFHVISYSLYLIFPHNVSQLKIHKQGRNADGSPRAPKLQLDIRRLEPLTVVNKI